MKKDDMCVKKMKKDDMCEKKKEYDKNRRRSFGRRRLLRHK
jgi:hypothetical protein